MKLIRVMFVMPLAAALMVVAALLSVAALTTSVLMGVFRPIIG